MIYKKINAGVIECDDGVVIRLHRQHISYIEDGCSIAVEIEYTVDGKMVVYGENMEHQGLSSNEQITFKIKSKVLKRIHNVLNFLEVEYEIE